MIDLHYDLLSVLYYCYKRDDYQYITRLQKQYQTSGIRGVVANLYFMSEDEMKEELGSYYEPIRVVDMFRIATELYQKFFPQLPVVFSIEGCDYIEGVEELEELYNLGLRNVLLVWNHKNKYGSGNNSFSGLSEEGKVFIRKAVDLGISIDLSHMNHQTFFDTISLLKEEKSKGKEVTIIASHSNSYGLYSHPRNLTDEQLFAMKEFDPIIGVVSYGPFVFQEEDREILAQKYLEHIEHVELLLGISCLGVSTDDMTFAKELFNEEEALSIFPLENITLELKKVLETKYNLDEINKILYQNSYLKLFERKR